MKMSVITPSIRPNGLKITFNSLRKQTFKDFEWLPRLSIPREKPDLCYNMNKALDEAKGELIVFLQDYIEIPSMTLQRVWNNYKSYPNFAFTYPVGKTDKYPIQLITTKDQDFRWDWRNHGKDYRDIDPMHWEIDFGSIPVKLLKGLRFDEDFDSGFGWDNVELGYRLSKHGVKFKVTQCAGGIAFDHDKKFKHPFKHKPNDVLWGIKRKYIDLEYGNR